jgi:hypothetical protein
MPVKDTLDPNIRVIRAIFGRKMKTHFFLIFKQVFKIPGDDSGISIAPTAFS